MLRQIIRFTSVLFWLALPTTLASAQTINLLQNPKGDDKTNSWQPYGQATVEQSEDGNWRFVVRNTGHFYQDIPLPEGDTGKYALLIGRVCSERINPDGAITGLPSLYGYMMDKVGSEGSQILAYLQGQRMLCWARTKNEWVTAWGVFQVPVGTRAIRFFLSQAERKDVPQNGSADDLGLFLFSTEEDARAYAQMYSEPKR